MEHVTLAFIQHLEILLSSSFIFLFLRDIDARTNKDANQSKHNTGTEKTANQQNQPEIPNLKHGDVTREKVKSKTKTEARQRQRQDRGRGKTEASM